MVEGQGFREFFGCVMYNKEKVVVVVVEEE